MIKTFVHNHFEVNSTLIYDETKEGVLIDVAVQRDYEKQELLKYIEDNNIKIVRLVLTHPHIDHVCGALWASETFGLAIEMDEDGEKILRTAEAQADIMGFDVRGINNLRKTYIKEGDKIAYGNSELEVLSTPGHCDGSLSFYSKDEETVVVGDILFYESVGRTDLPTGDYNLLRSSVHNKLFTLPPNTVCICGHGPNTSIKHEKNYNPFI